MILVIMLKADSRTSSLSRLIVLGSNALYLVHDLMHILRDKRKGIPRLTNTALMLLRNGFDGLYAAIVLLDMFNRLHICELFSDIEHLH